MQDSGTRSTQPIREPRSSFVLYWLLKWAVINPLFRLYFRGRVIGAAPVSLRGPLVVVSNHASDFDPPIVSNCLRRPIAFMAKEELFRIPVFKQAIALYGAYPVRRGTADRTALRAAMDYLDRGWATGVFLEGTRTADARIHNPKIGAALIAAKRQAPLLPVSIWGTNRLFAKGQKWPRPIPITVRIGDLLPPPPTSDRADLEATTAACAEAINQLHDRGR